MGKLILAVVKDFSVPACPGWGVEVVFSGLSKGLTEWSLQGCLTKPSLCTQSARTTRSAKHSVHSVESVYKRNCSPVDKEP
jgi:hypothetical protein